MKHRHEPPGLRYHPGHGLRSIELDLFVHARRGIGDRERDENALAAADLVVARSARAHLEHARDLCTWMPEAEQPAHPITPALDHEHVRGESERGKARRVARVRARLVVIDLLRLGVVAKVVLKRGNKGLLGGIDLCDHETSQNADPDQDKQKLENGECLYSTSKQHGTWKKKWGPKRETGELKDVDELKY